MLAMAGGFVVEDVVQFSSLELSEMWWQILDELQTMLGKLYFHPFTKRLSPVLQPIIQILMTSSGKRNLLFLMNNFNHKNMDEYVDNRQETNNLPNMELVDTYDINCPC